MRLLVMLGEVVLRMEKKKQVLLSTGDLQIVQLD